MVMSAFVTLSAPPVAARISRNVPGPLTIADPANEKSPAIFPVFVTLVNVPGTADPFNWRTPPNAVLIGIPLALAV